MRIALVCHLKYPISKPYHGGLEMFTHSLARSLIKREHELTLFASGDSDPALNVCEVVPQSTVAAFAGWPEHERPSALEAHEDAAYAAVMKRICRDDFDVVHNNTLNPVVLNAAGRCGVPAVTTLHVPPLPRLSSALRVDRKLRGLRFINVSGVNAENWSSLLPAHEVVHNGVDTKLWRPRSGDRRRRPRAVWTGRILADKGTHLAIDAAHAAGLPIDVAGPINDQRYFAEEVVPRLREDDLYHGLQQHEGLSELVAGAAVSLCTPCWDEPFGLVVSESLACGTPVAAFARGGPTEILDRKTGRLADPGDVPGLARAVTECLSLDRADCRRRAVTMFSVSSMVDRYERVYESMRPTPRTTYGGNPLYASDETTAMTVS